jgi:hypothetical protein
VADSFSVPQCTGAVLDVLANDTDPNGDALTLTDISGQAWQLGAYIQNNKIVWPASTWQHIRRQVWVSFCRFHYRIRTKLEGRLSVRPLGRLYAAR